MALRAKRGGRKPEAEAIAHSGFYPYVKAFLEHQRVTGAREANVKRTYSVLKRFVLWCDQRSLNSPQEITLPILERYQRYLHLYRKPDGFPLSLNTQSNFLVALKRFFKWLTRQHHILYNPAAELDLPRTPQSLPRAILSVEQIEAVLNEPDIDTLQGLRDRTMLETLYATGIRRGELIGLRIGDIDFARQALLVREGKGRRDRWVPLGARAAHWIHCYLDRVRPELELDGREPALFLTDYGEAYGGSALANNVKRYLRRAGIEAPGSCHLFRHAMATHMLGNGADIRYIQAILGHSKLSTTEVYTRVSLDKLNDIHAATHPGSRRRSSE